jgi:hypothetical protein
MTSWPFWANVREQVLAMAWLKLVVSGCATMIKILMALMAKFAPHSYPSVDLVKARPAAFGWWFLCHALWAG